MKRNRQFAQFRFRDHE